MSRKITRKKMKWGRRRHEQKAGKWKKRERTQRLAEPPLAVLDRSAVAMATSSPRLVFGAASGITAEDLMFSTHLGSANMALHSSALSIPCLGHSGWHPSDWRQNLSPSARLSGGSCHYGKRFCCHMQGPINRCKQSALPLLAEAQLPLSNSLQSFVHFFCPLWWKAISRFQQ